MDNSYTESRTSPTLSPVHWDRLFEELEGQLAAEWESERAALDAESERLRISRLELRSRLRMLCAAGATATVDLAGRERLLGVLRSLGADWIAADAVRDDDERVRRTTVVIPLHAVHGIRVDHGHLLSSLEPAQDDAMPPLRERMTLGFLLRDLARRRVPVRIRIADGDDLHGTIDRAGADHLDLAEHDSGQPRVRSAVRGFCVVPFVAISALTVTDDHLP